MRADLQYMIEVMDPLNIPIPVSMVAQSIVTLGPGAMGDAWLKIYDGTTAYVQEDCGAGELSSNCRDGLGPVTLAPIANASLTLQTNTMYTVDMEITINPEVVNGTVTAFLDPEFFLPDGSTDTIVYSDGITQAQEPSTGTPEPATLSLLGAGVSALLIARRKRQAQN